MKSKDYNYRFTVEQPSDVVFQAIMNPRAWWSSGIAGHYNKIGDSFTHSVADVHRCEMQVAELEPAKKVVWKVLKNYFNFTQDKTEWQNTDIVFEINEVEGGTEIIFTHIGLVPEYECYPICKDGWDTYLNSLRSLITTKQGTPNVGEAISKSEQMLMGRQKNE
jgi:hypothetical protein